ncbi:MAG: cobalamin-dependent protein [Deltaproteobacteria bacterium]|nr:cobalamin-dependent protein [Deltaproteobacteria bacterium]
MKIVLLSMPDVVPLLVHESAVHIANLGIASIGANIDKAHDVHIIDLIRKRRNVRKYLTQTLKKIAPDLVGLSAMAWQYNTCGKIMALIKQLLPKVKIVIGGYHATLMYREIAAAPEARFMDFMVRGEGEMTFRRLTEALDGKARMEDIPSLSYKQDGEFIHNKKGDLIDLAQLELPIRDKRRLTWGYHFMYSKIEALETSRGCTHSCSYCSMNHMYGRSFRTFPVERVLADLDDIYYNRKTRWVFIVDDNMVLNPKRVMTLCDAIIQRKYKNLALTGQADCISMARNEDMVKKMAQAGFRIIFLGIESSSKNNLEAAHKGDIVEASKQAIANCHKYGMMVIGGLIFGFPEDDEKAIMNNYRFFLENKVDAAYCQILTPYPRTRLREDLIQQELVTNEGNFRWYNGIHANIKTRHLDSDKLQYLVWYHRQKILGWWDPSPFARQKMRIWTGVWIYAFRPLLKLRINRLLRKYGWEGRYRREIARVSRMNVFPDLDTLK